MKQLTTTTILIVILFFNVNSYANPIFTERIILSDSAYITLLTCDPGEELYASFGHSAIGVFDNEQGIQILFNYGTFSFNTPNFYLKFAGGKLNYRLSISAYNVFLREYEREGRMVLQEELNLNKQQKQKLFDALIENYKPENREYLYDFFFDNCATRIIDMVEQVLGNELKHNVADQIKNKETFRNLIDSYLQQGSWSDVGIDLALGAIIDKPATEKQKTFLPYYLSKYMNNCEVGGKPLIKKANIVVQDTANYKPTSFLLSPKFIFWVIFIVILLFSLIFRHLSWVIADRLLFYIVGLVGVLVMLLWFATNHQATVDNWNLLWANPLYLVYAFFISHKSNLIRKRLSPIFLAINILVILLWNIIPQQFNFAFVPIIATVSIRLSFIIWRDN